MTRLLLENLLSYDEALENYMIPTSDITREIRTFKCGGFSDVYRGRWRQGHGTEEIIIKCLRGTKDNSEKLRKRLLREVVVWSNLRHENIASFYGLVVLEGKVVPGLVAPFILYNVMDYTQMRPEERSELVKQLARGLTYAHNHKQKIIHGDVNPNNLMVSEEGTLKIIDFGLTRMTEVTGFTTILNQANVRYMAPEILLSKVEGPDCKCDVFSFSMTMLQILHGKDRNHEDDWDHSTPYNHIRSHQGQKVFSAIRDGDRPHLENYRDISPTHSAVLMRCWSSEPSERPTMAQIMDLLSAPVPHAY